MEDVDKKGVNTSLVTANGKKRVTLLSVHNIESDPIKENISSVPLDNGSDISHATQREEENHIYIDDVQR